MCSGGAASAALVDFTASSSTSGMAGGIGWSLTASPGDTITFESSDAPGPIGGLAGLNDGVGLNDDEISNGLSGEYVTVIFDRAVRLTRFSVLDLFKTSADEESPETAYLFASADPAAAQLGAVEASEVYAPGGFGFGSAAVDLVGDTFTFRAGSGNDGVGTGDFALAGLEISEVTLAAVPLPASAALLGAALLGIGTYGRRRDRT